MRQVPEEFAKHLNALALALACEGFTRAEVGRLVLRNYTTRILTSKVDVVAERAEALQNLFGVYGSAPRADRNLAWMCRSASAAPLTRLQGALLTVEGLLMTGRVGSAARVRELVSFGVCDASEASAACMQHPQLLAIRSSERLAQLVAAVRAVGGSQEMLQQALACNGSPERVLRAGLLFNFR